MKSEDIYGKKLYRKLIILKKNMRHIQKGDIERVQTRNSYIVGTYIKK